MFLCKVAQSEVGKGGGGCHLHFPLLGRPVWFGLSAREVIVQGALMLAGNRQCV